MKRFMYCLWPWQPGAKHDPMSYDVQNCWMVKFPTVLLCMERGDMANGHGTHPRALKIQSVMDAWCRWWGRYRDEGQELAVTELAVSVPWDWRKKQPRVKRAFPPLLRRHDWWLPVFCAHPCRCRHFLLSQSTLNLQHELKQWKIYARHG